MLINVNLFNIKHLGTAFQIKERSLPEGPWAEKKKNVKYNNLFETHKAGCLSFI